MGLSSSIAYLIFKKFTKITILERHYVAFNFLIKSTACYTKESKAA